MENIILYESKTVKMYKWVLKWRVTFTKGLKMEVKDKKVAFFWLVLPRLILNLKNMNIGYICFTEKLIKIQKGDILEVNLG